MSKLFDLAVVTPEREFFSGKVEAVTAHAPDGSVTILADHEPLIMPVSVGTISFKKDGQWESAINSEGFMEVHLEGVLIFVQSCERPEEIDTRRAMEAKKRAEEKLRQKQSVNEYKQSKVALARAMVRLQESSKSVNYH